MSQRPYGSGNRHSLMDNYSLERAAPRSSGQSEKHVHPVVRVPSTGVPSYARATELYPMRSSTEKDNYRYRPTSSSLGGTNPDAHPTSPTASNQTVSIPIVHMSNQSRGPATNYGQIPIDTSNTLSDRSDLTSSGHRTPTYQTSSYIQSAGTRPRTPSITNEQEAKVDHLTNLLMQSMETKPSSLSSTSLITSKPSLMGSNDGLSPSGSFRRNSGSSTPIGYNNQISRLQQHVGLSSSPTPNGGRGSPLNMGTMSSSITTNTSATNSPTESITSLQAVTDQLSNICFRCKRTLIPLEGSTLNSRLNNGANNVVTLTGALGVRLHVACFTCYRCSAPLRSDAHYHNSKRLLCPTCVRDCDAEPCSTCHRPIGDRILHAIGKTYHPSCFVCVVCGCRLDSKLFTIDVHGGLHCMDDFHRRYAPRCAYCNRPIVCETARRETHRVVYGDGNYHVECYTQHVASGQNTSGSGNMKIGTKMISG